MTHSPTPAQFLIRPAQNHDVEAVADILAMSFYGHLLSPTIAPPQDLANYQNLLNQIFSQIKHSCWQLMRWGIVLDLEHRLKEDMPHHAWLVAVSVADPHHPLATLEICLRSGLGKFSHVSSHTRLSHGVGHWSTWLTDLFDKFWFSIWSSHSQYPYIFNVAVHPEFRRQGAARELLQSAEKTVQGWGYGQLMMHVLESNYGARHLYGQEGYQVVGIEDKIWSWLWQRPYKLVLKKSFPVANSFSHTQPHPPCSN